MANQTSRACGGHRKVAGERQANNRKDSPQVRCLPSAVLRRGPLVSLVQARDVLVEISDDDSPGFHQIYLNQRGHPGVPDLLWYGDSVGRWDGDTLIVDRVTLSDGRNLFAGSSSETESTR